MNGPAIGGGAGLVACADVAVAVEGARFAFAEVRLGLLPAVDRAVRGARDRPGPRPRALHDRPRVRRRRGRDVRARASRRAGRRGSTRPSTRWLGAYLACGPEAVAANKRLVRDATASLALTDLPDRIAAARASDEGQEGIAAFLEKRPPRWSRLRRLLIANRGEIAVRIVRRAARPGISPVVAVTAGERDALPADARRCHAWRSPSYLDAEALVEAATRRRRRRGAPRLRVPRRGPGVRRARVGGGARLGRPAARRDAPPRRQDAVARRSRGRRACRSCPASTPTACPTRLIEREAALLGPPLLVKAAGRRRRSRHAARRRPRRPCRRGAGRGPAGGGGRASATGASSWNDGSKASTTSRCRCCSTSTGTRCISASATARCNDAIRRSSKSRPSPGVDDELRAALGEAAIAHRPSAAGYRGAGTAEFLLGADGEWWFLEMNAACRSSTRSPRRSPASTWCARSSRSPEAAGSPVDRAGVSLRGPCDRGARLRRGPGERVPAGERVASTRLELPSWPGVRIDTALVGGDVVGLGFDPAAREGDRLGRGPPGRDRPAPSGARRGPDRRGHHQPGVPARCPRPTRGRRGHRPTRTGSSRSWRPEVPDLPGRGADAEPSGPGPLGRVRTAGTVRRCDVAGSHAQFRGWAYRLGDDELEAVRAVAAAAARSPSPMPASVLRVDVEPGDAVTAGQVLAMLEAMKIQVQVDGARSPAPSRAVHVRAGDVVARGDTPDRAGGGMMAGPVDRTASGRTRSASSRSAPATGCRTRKPSCPPKRRWRSSRRSPARASRSSRSRRS